MILSRLEEWDEDIFSTGERQDKHTIIYIIG